MTRRLIRPLFFTLLAVSTGQASSSAAGVNSPPSSASLPPESAVWNRFESAHFTVLSDASEREARKLTEDLERFRSVLATLHPRFVIDPSRPAVIFIFKDEKDFQPYEPRGKLVGGYFVRTGVASYLVTMAGTRGDALYVYHEFIHELLTENIPNSPVWFSEGIAMYYETFSVQKDHIFVGLAFPDYVRLLKSQPMIPLDRLFQVTLESPEYNEANRMTMFYAESWLVVHYLLNGNPQLRPHLGAFLDRLEQGVPMDQAFQTSFGIDYKTLEGQLQKYAHRGDFPYGTATEHQALKTDKSVSVVRVGRDEVLASLGSLLASTDSNESANASAYFQEALRVNPNCAAAEAGLGYLAVNQKSFTDAISHFAAASALDPKNYQYPYLAALAWLSQSTMGHPYSSPDSQPTVQELTRAQDLLRTSIQLKPEFAEAIATLGEIYAEMGQNLGQGMELLEKAHKLLPNRMDVVLGLVFLHLKAGNREAAGSLVQRVIVPSGNGEAIRQAQSALDSYDRARPSSSAPTSGTNPSP